MRIPIWVEASRLNVLIFGGGSVGTRRAKLFASAGAKVRVLAKQVSPEIKELGVEIKEVDLWHYDPSEDIEWAHVVVIAVNDEELATRLFKMAEAKGKLVNDATDAGRTHVVVPYERQVAGLRVAVTSEGVAGGAARLSLDVIEDCIRRSWIPTLYEVYSRLKAEAKSTIHDVKKRMEFYYSLWENSAFREAVMNNDAKTALEVGRKILLSLADFDGK